MLLAAGLAAVPAWAQDAASNAHPAADPAADAIAPSCFDRAFDEVAEGGTPEPFYPSSIVVTLNKSSQRAWAVNQMKAMTSSTRNIPDSAKKRFKAKVNWPTPHGKCKSKAKVRLTGDWRDHIGYSGIQIYSSVAIKLRGENLANTVRFKLLLPVTRGDDKEILATTIFRAFGFLAPETRMIQADVNGHKAPYLYQEMPAKEFLERNNLRESVVVEGDERWIWSQYENVKFWKGKTVTSFWDESRLFARIDNAGWLKNPTALDIGLAALTAVNPLYQQYRLDVVRLEGLDELVAPDRMEQIDSQIRDESLFSLLSKLVGGDHGLRAHNRKFYYDPTDQMLVPIYYDGNAFDRKVPTVERLDKIFPERALRRVVQTLSDKEFRDTIFENYHLRGGKSSRESIDAILLGMAELTRSLTPPAKDQVIPETEMRVDLDFLLSDERVDEYEFFGWNIESETVEFCIARPGETGVQLTCRPYLDQQAAAVLEDPRAPGGDPVPFIGAFRVLPDGEIRFSTPNPLAQRVIENPGLLALVVAPGEIVFLDYDPTHAEPSVVSIELGAEGAKVGRVVVRGRVPKGSSFSVKGTRREVEGDVRYDTRLLTSCLSFFDANLDRVKIDVRMAPCEDGANFVRAFGNVESILVEDAGSDAIDADFSGLSFDRVVVRNAGNDCMDLSAGRYEIGTLNAESCGDKGLSIGERAQVQVEVLDVGRALTGAAAKDSSTLRIASGRIAESIPTCLSSYRKKQEFDGGKIIAPAAMIRACGDRNFEQRKSVISASRSQPLQDEGQAAKGGDS